MATRSVNAVLGFVKLLDDLAEVASGSGAAAALEAVLEQTGYLAGAALQHRPAGRVPGGEPRGTRRRRA